MNIMRIRLRVPPDGEENSGGLRGWFQRLRDSFMGSLAPSVGTRMNKRQPDKRWLTHGDTKYFFEGVHCRNTGGAWQSEYVFSVLAGDELQQIRVVLPEAPVTAWEQRQDRRMSEEHRLRLALESVESLVGLSRFPAAITVSAEAIAAVSKV